MRRAGPIAVIAFVMAASLVLQTSVSLAGAGVPAKPATDSFGTCWKAAEWPPGGASDPWGASKYFCSIAANDRGQVAYTSDVVRSDGVFRHALFASPTGIVTDIGAKIEAQLGRPANSAARDINRYGLVVGVYQDRVGGGEVGFLWRAGAPTVTLLDSLTVFGLSPQGFDPHAVNDRGDVVFVGWFPAQGSLYLSFVRWANGTISVLPNYGVASTEGPNVIGNDISNTGQVVGWYAIDRAPDDQGSVPFIWTKSMTSLKKLRMSPGRYYGSAEGINNKGKIVGMSYGDTPPSATMWSLSAPTVILPWQGSATGYYSSAFAINDTGRIVGVTSTPRGQESPMRAVSWYRGHLRVFAPTLGTVSAATYVTPSGNVYGVIAPNNSPDATPLVTVHWR